MSSGREAQLAQLRKGVLEYCVLAQLREAPSYGLKLASQLTRHPHLFSSEGTIYPLLARARKLGWVDTTWEESTGGPPRRIYNITAVGIDALDAFIESWGPFVKEATTMLNARK